MPSKNQVSNGLTYVAQKPAFLANFGQPARTSPPPRGRGPRGGAAGGSDGREALPERPREGQWAQGSGDEREEDEGSDDEWGERFGGGGDDGPQVVVLKEGRHLSGEEVKRERRRAKGLPSVSPPPKTPSTTTTTTQSTFTSNSTSTKPIIPKPHGTSAKRKLVGLGTDDADAADSSRTARGSGKDGKAAEGQGEKKKKKKKAKKGMLSFDQAEGEE